LRLKTFFTKKAFWTHLLIDLINRLVHFDATPGSRWPGKTIRTMEAILMQHALLAPAFSRTGPWRIPPAAHRSLADIS
jgi:hypothetical protein